MIFRVFKVFSQDNLIPTLQSVSAMVHGSVSSSVHKSGVFAAGDQESIL
jgi:hypothetical protein